MSAGVMSWLGSVVGLVVGLSAQEPGTAKGFKKLSQTQGGVMPVLDTNDQLGRSVASLGDLDGNGVIDLASAGLGDDDGGTDQGCAYVIFLRADGLSIGFTKISQLTGGFGGDLDPGDQFGRDLANLGDLDGDGVTDLVVGANYDDDGGLNRGAIYLLRLNPDGTVRETSKISHTQGGFVGPLVNNDEFGRSVASLGDLDGDGVLDLAVGAPTDSTGGTKRGAVYVLFLNQDGTVKSRVKIASGLGGFTGRLRNTDWFGFSLANMGDCDGDGVVDLAVGAALDDDGVTNAGAAWLLYLRPDGTVKDWRKFSMRFGGFAGVLESPDQFGTSVAHVGDLDGDGITELAVGAVKDGDGGKQRGAVYILFLDASGAVKFHRKLSSTEGGFTGRLDNIDWFGSSLASLGDFDGDGVPDLAIGARNDDDGGPNKGALYLTYLNGSTSALLAGSGLGSAGTLSLATPLVPEPEPAAGPLADVRVAAAGPEPVGDLELVAGDGTPGSALRFRLTVPEALRGRDATAVLVAGERLLDDASTFESAGILLDPRTRLGSAHALATDAHAEVEITLEVPRTHALESLALQAVWSTAQGERVLTDALELALPR